MAGRSPVKVGLALILICVISYGQASDSCRTGCQGASLTFKYHEGTTYKYTYDSKVQTSLSSAEGQQSVTEIKATVLLTQQAQCNQVLRLQNVQVISNDGKKYNQLPDVEKPIRVNFHDGHLEDSICITPGDSQNSLNLKRAVASILQANLKSGNEVDVFGACPTDVSSHKEGNVLVVEKSRNLNRCAFRENINKDFLATVFNPNSEIKSSPVLNGDYNSKLRIKNGILEQAVIRENYLYVPFSVGQNGAKTSVETTLKYVGTAKDNAQIKVSQPRSIIFDDPHPVNSPNANVNGILNAVKEVAKTIDITVGEDTARAFTNLIRILRVSKKDNLLAVYNQVKAGVGFPDKLVAKKIFLDALLRAENGDNVEVAIELLKSKELSVIEQNLVYLGLSTVRHATEGSLNAAVGLFNQPNLPRSAYIGVGNLAGRYCRQHSCQNVDAVNKVIQQLIQKIGNGKASNRQAENEIIYALKGLANIRTLSDNILSKIVAIAQDRKASNRLRITALETYLADPCKDKLRDSALGILKDIQQDSEVRIRAFLALAQCPNNKVGSAIKALLETEPSYQVGGFIVSYIRNLRASANPDKESAKQYLAALSLPKRFPFDLRKYSANGEFSYTVDTLGLANSVETNIIYSQDSFLPRSTSINLTAEVFGHSLNFLELELRQENLDRLVESYLGPRGLLRSSTLNELWNDKGKSAQRIIQQLQEQLQKTLRARRDVSKAEIDGINKQVQIRANELNTDLDLDFSVKSFGSELLFLNLNEDVKEYTPEAIIDKIASELNNDLDRLKNFDETLRSNLLFLDAEFAYPTSSGFPLRLVVEGTSNVQVKAAGAIDIRALLKGAGTIKILLIPSATVEVTGRITIDTLVVESGLKVVSNLHTSTGGDLTVELSKKAVDVKFSLPVKKQNLISATHKFVFHTKEWGASEVNTPLKFAQGKDFSICLDQLSTFIGLTFCGEYTAPNLQGQNVPILPFPLSGDAKVSVVIEREDLSLYHYKEVLYDESKIGVQGILEALDEKGRQKSSLELDAFILPEKVVRASFKSSVATALLEGRITNTANEKSLSLRLAENNNEYFGKVGIAVEGTAAKSIYKPIVQYSTPQNRALQVPPYRVEGRVIAEQKGPQETIYTLDNVRLITPDQKAIAVNGKLGTEPETVLADVAVSDGSNSASFAGKLRTNPNLVKYTAEFRNSINPVANIRLKGELSRSNEELKNFFQIAHGGDFSNKKNILTLENSVKQRNKGPQDFLLETKNELTYPALGLNLEFEFDLKPKALEYELDVQYSNIKLGSELKWEHNTKSEGTDFKAVFGIWGLNNQLYLKSKRQVTGEQSKIENSLEINGKRVEVNGNVKHHIKPQDVDVGADLIVKIPKYNVPFKVLSNLKLNANEIDASHKVTSGNTVYIDAFLKTNRDGNANGSIKVNLKGQLVVNGQIKSNKGNGNGEVTIELPEFGQITKIDTTFTIRDPTYNILLNIYPVFNQDKSKKVTLSTQTSLTEDNFNSKNLIDVLGEKLELNVKGNRQGDLDNGKLNGEVEATFLNNRYLVAKLNREMKNVNGVLNGNLLASLEFRQNKNQPGDKVTIKGQLRNTKLEKSIFDVSYQLSAEGGNGRNINVDLGLKRQPQGEAFVVEIANKIYGSALSNPVDAIVKTNYKNGVGSYDLKASYVPLGSLSANGKFDVSGNPFSGDIVVDLTSTCKTLKSFKLNAGGSILQTKLVAVKGQLEARADSPEGIIFQFATTGEVKSDDNECRLKGSLKSGQIDPISVDAGVSRSENKNNQQIRADLTLDYGKNKKLKTDLTLIRLPSHEYKLDAKLDIPSENFRSNRLQVHSKRNEEATHYQSEIILTSDGKTWTTNTDLLLSETIPAVDIKTKYPDGKLSQILIKVTKLNDRELEGQLKVVNQNKNFLLEGTIDADVESVDEFHIKITTNAPSLKIDKYVIEIQNKPAKTGRRIQVTAKSGNKNILVGSTSYTTREEQGKLIIEGSGSFKVHDQTQSANFKYIRQNLNQAKNGETGLEISFDAGLGNKAIDAELKLTNRQFRILNSYCEEKKQCAHIEVDVKTALDNVNYFNQEIEVAVDLRKLGLSHEFGLKAVTTRKEYILDHTVDVHFQSQDNSKYQYSLYLHPKEAGVSLTTPRRVISLEANANLPPNILKDGGRVSGEVVLYLDKKNQPNTKSGLIAFLDVRRDSVVGEARFTNPGLRRPFIVSLQSKITNGYYESTITADVFAQPDQKLVATYKLKWSDPKNLKRIEYSDAFAVKSSGLGIDILYEDLYLASTEDNHYKSSTKLTYAGSKTKYDSALIYEYTPKNFRALLKILNVDLLKVNSQLQLSRDEQIVDSELSCYGHSPLVSHLEVKNLNRLKFTLARKDKPNDKLQVNSGLIPGQIADFRAEVTKNGVSHELGHGTIKLDDANFLKSDYNVQSKNIEEFLLNPLQAGVQEEGRELKQLSEELAKNTEEEFKRLGEISKRAIPNLQPLRQYYIGELNKIKEEILQDKTIKDISEFLYSILSALSQAFEETFAHLSELIENIVRTLQATFGKVLELTEKELLPNLKDISNKLLKLAVEIVETATHVVLTVSAKAIEILEKYKPQLQQLATVMGEVSQDIFKTIISVVEAVKTIIVDESQQLYNELKNLSIVEQAKAEYERFVKHGLPSAEVLAKTIQDILATFKDIVPTPQFKELIDAVSDYITKKITNQKIDDQEAISKILKLSMASAASIYDLVIQGTTSIELQDVKVPGLVNYWNRLPRLAAVRLSPVSYVLSDSLDVPIEFLLSLVNKPRNWIPPFPLYGLIAQGLHIFTFDGRHLTFPGKCRYVLAHDAVDRNFTVVGTYSDGLLTEISLTQGSDTITLKKQGQITVNNARSELPARKPNIAAYRDDEKIVLISAYGVRVVCGPELIVCSVTASGFYHGKLRGLLGNGNNEPYDDLAIPNGKIVTSESEFGNSYKTASDCAPVQAVSHQGHRAASCEKLFGWESNLRFCYPFVNTANFKTACQHGLATNVKDTEQAIAIAYVAACAQHNIPVRVPSEFVKCSNGDKPTSPGDTFSVRTPGKIADIVLLVDTNKENEAAYKEYIQPLVQQLTNELNNRGIKDVEFHLIAYGGENQWPSHITVDGKMTFKGKAPSLRFTESPREEVLVTGCSYLDGLIELTRNLESDLKLALGLDLQALTYNEGLQYPFRANAIKSVIAVTSRPCQVGRFYPLQLLRTLLYRGKEVNLNLITPVSRSGAKAEAKNIVGFNSRNVYALGATKNKIKYFSDLSKELTYDDYCIDFTVQNDGNVFISDHVLLQPKATRKQFIALTSHGIVEQLLGYEKMYECECKFVTPFSAKNVCKVAFVKEKTPARKAGAKTPKA